MKHIIGIDTGTNSVGWSLVKEDDDNQIELIDIGTYIFPIGTNVDATSNAETTKNEQRRIYRGTKRNLFRYKLRRKKLRALLQSFNMLPDFKKYYKVKKKLQSVDIYELRVKAINKQLPLEDIGRIFLLLNKYRGFKSNAKKQILTDDEKTDKQNEESRKVKSGIEELTKLINNTEAKTIGEYFYILHKKAKELYDAGKWHNPNELIDERALNENGEIVLNNSRGIRRQYGRYTAREMYQHEFDLIWAIQKQHYDSTHPHIFTGCAEEYKVIKQLPVKEKIEKLKEFRKTNYWQIRNYCIYYQRPLRSQRKYLSNCQFVKNKKVIPASHPLYQEFRIWKNLADIRYTCMEDNIINQPLPREWKRSIADYLEVNEKIFIAKTKKADKNKTYLIDILSSAKPTTVFKTEDEEIEKYIKGNLTYFAFQKILTENRFKELQKQNKIEALWHHIYMAKDDEWLKDTLLDKWIFDESPAKHEEIVNKLIDFGLEEDYGSYSAKAIKKILPFMREGKDEYDALVLAGYKKAPDEVKEEIILKDKITQLKYQELRNPVVEKSVSQVIKTVNALLEKYKSSIDRQKLEIRIESTRELKKPRQQRENLLRDIRKKDTQRQEYADFLNMKREEGAMNFNRKIYKSDSIIGKFELWLEMKMDRDDPAFLEFERITRKGDGEKHRLWLECNRLCPYTGQTINLTRLFSPEIEIEHIIPLSRSLDDSFTNKTLTFSSVNHEKGQRTAFEYMQNDLDGFKKRIKDFPDSKREQFLRQDVKKDFTNDQIGNAGYIAKYVREKMQEICRFVQFTNGSATAKLRRHDWKISDLLDKIRFEEEKGIDIESYLQKIKLYRKDFIGWYKKKENSTDVKINFNTVEPELIAEYENQTKNNLSECIKIVNLYSEFRSKDGKKDRSDHRHHAIDSFITACCSPTITKYLSTYNRVREEQGIPEYDEFGNLTRELIDRPFDYAQLKQKIKGILVCHNVNQKLITSRKNKHKTKNGIREQKTYAPQGALHKDGLYGKLKNPAQQGIEREDAYVKRVPLNYENQVAFSTIKDLEKIYDKRVRTLLEKRIEKYGNGEKAFNKEALEKDPIYLYSIKAFPNGSSISKKGKPLPVIKNVRVMNKNSRNLIQLKALDENKNVVNQNRYAETEGNYVMALYELKEENKKGKVKVTRDFRLLSFFEAVNRKRKGQKLFDDIIEKDEKHLSLMKDCHWLKQGDIVAIHENDEIKESILQRNKPIIIPRLYKVVELNKQVNIDKKTGKENSFGVIKLSNVSKLKTKGDSYITHGNFIKVLHTGVNAIKVRLNILGEIEKIGEECFE